MNKEMEYSELCNFLIENLLIREQAKIFLKGLYKNDISNSR